MASFESFSLTLMQLAGMVANVRRTPKDCETDGRCLSRQKANRWDHGGFECALCGASILFEQDLNNLTASPVGVRITFAEQFGSSPVFRTAAFLSYPDAQALRDLLVRQLSKLEHGTKSAPATSVVGEKAAGSGAIPASSATQSHRHSTLPITPRPVRPDAKHRENVARSNITEAEKPEAKRFADP